MTRWPIERSWVILGGTSAPKEVRSSDLLNYRAVGMLGAAGLGKTYELSYLVDLDRKCDRDVRDERLVVFGQTTTASPRG